jgi:hypothetical protein
MTRRPPLLSDDAEVARCSSLIFEEVRRGERLARRA